MTTLMFQPKFHELVATGVKRQTIRPPRRDGRPNAKVGDTLSLRKWAEKPYRSTQERLREDVACVFVGRVKLYRGATSGQPIIEFKDGWAVNDGAEAFAKADGFDSAAEMFDWFESIHTLPFEGVLIKW